MHFTHRHHSNPEMRLGDQTITVTKELRWLVLWLDPKLTFNNHISKMQQRRKATVAQIQQISSCFWGLNPQETRKLITAVLKPRILFGGIAWLTERNKRKVEKIFNVLQNSASHLILGAFRSSPTNLLCHDTNTLSFMDLATRAHHFFIYEQLTAPSNHPTRKNLEHSLSFNPDSHQDSIHQLIGRQHLIMEEGSKLETIKPYPAEPWKTPYSTIENLSLPKDDAVQVVRTHIIEETNRGSLVIFTDRSYLPAIG